MWKLKLTILVILAVCCCAAESASWNDRAPLITQYGCEGLPLSLTCRKPPPGRINWWKTADTKKPSQITTDHRIKIDVKGTLQFSCADVTDTAVYKCGVSGNSTITFGSPVHLKVIKVDTSFRDDEITKTVTQSNPSRTIKTMSEKDLCAGQVNATQSTSSMEKGDDVPASLVLIGSLVGVFIALALLGAVGVVMIRCMLKENDNPPWYWSGTKDGDVDVYRGEAASYWRNPIYGI